MEIREFADRCFAFRAGYSESDRENSTRNDRREVVDTVESDVVG